MASDAELVGRFLEGDEAAFEQLVRRYESRIRKLAYGYLRDTGLAEDVAQEAFLLAYQKLSTLGEAKAFRSWLYRITINRAHDELRRISRKGEVRSSDEDDDQIARLEAPESLEHRVQWRDFGRRISGLLAELPEKYRKPLLLKEIEGMTYAEIAELLGWPMGTVQIRIHRARLRLRGELKERGLGIEPSETVDE